MTAFHQWLAVRAQQRARAGLTRDLVVREPDRPVVDLAGNDYLGLARDPRVTEAAADAARAYGGGAGASRLVTGTLAVHQRLEQTLAGWMGFGAALAMSTGYHANLAAVTALTDAETLIVSDAHVHASLIDACRLSRAKVSVVAHNDVEAVTTALRERSQPRAVVVVESIYSVLGDAAPLARLAEACSAYDAVLLVDEAHALGVCDEGRGLLHEAGLAGHDDVVATVTMSKALGSQGGAVLGTPAVRDHLVNTARPFIYDTGLAPAAAGAALAALEIVAEEPQRVASVRECAELLARACRVEPVPGAVLAVPMAGPQEAVDAVALAAEKGVLIGCFRPPSTPDGLSRLRLTAHAHLDRAELAHALGVLEELVS